MKGWLMEQPIKYPIGTRVKIKPLDKIPNLDKTDPTHYVVVVPTFNSISIPLVMFQYFNNYVVIADERESYCDRFRADNGWWFLWEWIELPHTPKGNKYVSSP